MYTAAIREKESIKVKVNIDELCYLFYLFVSGSICGWIYEMIYCGITEGVIRNRGILYGPWLPIYGVGAVGIYFLKQWKNNPVRLFLMSALVAGIVEYVLGFVGIHFFGLRLWDYSGMFLNLNGIICFASVVCFACMGLLFHYLAEPFARKLYFKFSTEKTRKRGIVILVILAVDFLASALFRTPITY